MSLRKRRNLLLLAVFHFIMLAAFLPGCKEGTKTSPVSSMLITDTAATKQIDLTSSPDAVHSISGVVSSQNTSENLSNIIVKLYFDQRLADETKTTSDGQFFFANVPPGLYEISFSTDSGTYTATNYIIRVLESGKTQPETIAVKMTAANPQALVIQAKIEGEVVLAGTGAKIPNINVEIEDAGGNLVSTALSSSVGQFTFQNLGTGTYTVKAGKASSYVETQQTVTIRNDGVVSPRYVIVSLNTKPVESFSISGFIRNQTKNGLANLEIGIYNDFNLTVPALQPTRTTGEGKFFFEGLTEARMYYLRVAANPPTTEASEVYPVRVLSDGTTSPSLAEIVVTQGSKVVMTDIVGKIVDAFTGGPLEYVSVKIADINSSVTDTSGLFKGYNLIPGNYKLEFAKFGYETLITSIQVKEDKTTIPASLTFALLHNLKTGYGSLSGRIVNVNDGSGIQDLWVRLFKWVQVTKKSLDGSIVETDWEWQPNLLITTRTSGQTSVATPDLKGTFKFTHLEPGKYLIYIASDSFVPVSADENRGGHFTWKVPSAITTAVVAPAGKVAEIRNLEVIAGQTTYWTNYEQAYK